MSLGLHIDRVGALIEDKQWDLARVMSQSSLRLYPDEPQLLRMSLLASYQLGDLSEALESSRQLISLSDEPRDLYNFGTLALEQSRPTEAKAALERVLELQPDHLSARANLVAACNELGELDRSLSLSDDADLSQHPAATVANFVCNLATGYRDAGQPEHAMAFYAHAMALCDGWHTVAASNRLYAANFDPQLSAFEIETLHSEWGRSLERRSQARQEQSFAARTATGLPRIGFISGDLRRHSVAYFLEPVWEALRGQAEIVAFENNPSHDEITDSLRELASTWVSIRGVSDADARNFIRAQQLDLVIDLSGHTANNRLPLLVHRLARRQATYLGYPNTSGLANIDYRFVDGFSDPSCSPWQGSEERIQIGQGFLAYRGPKCDVKRERTGNGLVFGSFNTPAKVNGALLKVWAEALKAHPSARLLLKNKAYGSRVVQSRVLKTLSEAGVSPERVEFRPSTPSLQAHLETYNELDVALDTYPYQGTTTTCEALFMGVPVVSLCGDRHASRVAHTLAHQAGPEWVRCVSDTQGFVQQVTEIVGASGQSSRRALLGRDEAKVGLHAGAIAQTFLDACT